ncbi:MAG: TorF family putative porin [Betaproteobacteria bacterium]
MTLAIAILSGLAATVAQAQTAPAAPPAPLAPAAAEAAASPLTFNVGVWSQYIFRGLSQTDYKPAVQGGADFAHDSGLYVGVWGSNIQWLRDFGISSGRVELDIYGGYKKSVGDFAFDVGFLRYQYLGSVHEGFTNPNTNELYAAASYTFTTLKYSHAISNAFGNPESKHSYYLDLTSAIPVAEGWTLTLHGGRQNFHGPTSEAATYTDWKAEIAKDLGNGLSAGAGYTGTDADKSFYTPVDKRFVGKHTGYAFVKYNF